MESSFVKFSTRFNMLSPKNETTIAEYIWIGGSGFDLRSKTMCIPKVCEKLEDFPTWNFDGSSTSQAQTENSEVILKPVYFCPDPFRLNSNSEKKDRAYLVLCETFNSDSTTPAKANFRYYAQKVFKETENEKPWFGFEQEYILLKYEGTFTKWPIGFPKGGFACPQGQYYCSVGSTNAIGRYVAEAHMKCCLAAGILLSGINAEVFPGQWEFQIGPAEGLDACDQLWMARYILTRICEEFDVEVTFEPKPVKGEWNGSGCHANISFESTRKERGYDRIIEAMELLSKRHKEHIKVYGKHNEERLTGDNETACLNEFKYGAGDRGASVRIPNKTAREKKGYFEDRRPSSNMDPYLVGGMLADTSILKIKYGDEMLNAFETFLKNESSQ